MKGKYWLIRKSYNLIDCLKCLGIPDEPNDVIEKHINYAKFLLNHHDEIFLSYDYTNKFNFLVSEEFIFDYKYKGDIIIKLRKYKLQNLKNYKTTVFIPNKIK